MSGYQESSYKEGSTYDEYEDAEPTEQAKGWTLGEDVPCDRCGAAAGDDCYEDCPYETGEEIL